jgi:hypothetical protein
LKHTARNPGKFNTVLRTGTRLKKLIATGKKPLKKKKITKTVQSEALQNYNAS